MYFGSNFFLILLAFLPFRLYLELNIQLELSVKTLWHYLSAFKEFVFVSAQPARTTSRPEWRARSLIHSTLLCLKPVATPLQTTLLYGYRYDLGGILRVQTEEEYMGARELWTDFLKAQISGLSYDISRSSNRNDEEWNDEVTTSNKMRNIRSRKHAVDRL